LIVPCSTLGSDWGVGQVLATDGVWDNVYEEDMTRVVQVTPECTILVHLREGSLLRQGSLLREGSRDSLTRHAAARASCVVRRASCRRARTHGRPCQEHARRLRTTQDTGVACRPVLCRAARAVPRAAGRWRWRCWDGEGGTRPAPRERV
jgi:hypothetical protein